MRDVFLLRLRLGEAVGRETLAYPTLKKRAEFLAVRGGARWSTSSVTVEAKVRAVAGYAGAGEKPEAEVVGEPAQSVGSFRFGYTVTKKLGGAVRRNRIRRRLKAAVEAVAGEFCRPGFDYVLVARPLAHDREFDQLKLDLAEAFKRVHQSRRPSKKPARPA